MENESLDYMKGESTPERPPFLTVLCILTWLYSGYAFISGVFSFFVAKSFNEDQWKGVQEQLAEAMEGIDGNAARIVESLIEALSEMVVRGVENAALLNFTEIAVALLSAFGAYLMFNLKKAGFNIYVAAKFLGIVVPLAVFGINLLTAAVYAIALLVGLFIIFLYSLNRKHMR
jgi:Na+/melibiose symporter-like transporter